MTNCARVQTLFVVNRKGTYGDGGHKRPSSVKFDELFWVKVQFPVEDHGRSMLLLYDKRMECQVTVGSSSAAY